MKNQVSCHGRNDWSVHNLSVQKTLEMSKSGELILCCLLHVSLRLGTKFTWIVIIKILPLAYHRGHFLVSILDITLFQNSLLGSCTLSLQLGCFGLDFTSFCNCMQWSWHITVIKSWCYLPYSVHRLWYGVLLFVLRIKWMTFNPYTHT